MKKNLAIILAGGKGSRIGDNIPKQFLNLAGKPILQYAIEKFENFAPIHGILIVTPEKFIQRTEKLVSSNKFVKVKKILPGGENRQESSCLGVQLADPREYVNVLIHDAVRPFVSPRDIAELLNQLNHHDAVTLGSSATDTVVQVDSDDIIREFLDRDRLMNIQTPQAFKLKTIQQAHLLAVKKDLSGFTDDCSLVRRLRLAPIKVIKGNSPNMKITYPIDFKLAEKIVDLVDSNEISKE